MNFTFSLGEITHKAIDSFKRYPVTLTWSILGTLFTIWYVEQAKEIQDSTQYLKIILIASMGVSWLISTRFLITYFKDVKQQQKQWLILIPLLFLAWYYWYLPSTKDGFNNSIYGYKTFLYFLVGHLCIFFSPFLLTWNKAAYWNYLKSIFIAIARSLLFSIVLYLGLTLALLALKYLFKIDFDDKIYFKLFIFCLGIVNTWIYLSDFPKQIHQNTTVNYPKPLEIFVKYILIPLAALYLVILYAYSFKILINWSLPKGWVSYLVIALSLLGFIIHILINPIKNTIKSRAIQRFYPWFYILLLPMIVLLFTAIFKRITTYGFTENRYFVFILACWILGMTLYILFSKKKQLRYFPMVVSIISLLASFGFWGAFSISENSQVDHFNTLYETIKSNNNSMNFTEKDRFESITRYLHKRNALNKINKTVGFDIGKQFKKENSWNIANKLIDTLQITIIRDDTKVNRTHFSFHNNKTNLTITTKGYDFMKRFNIYNRNNNTLENISTTDIEMNFKDATFIFTTTNNNKHLLDLKPILKQLKARANRYEIPDNLSTTTYTFEDLDVKLIIEDISFNKALELTNFSGIILIKEK